MNIKFLMIMCMAILLVGSVSAMEIDNVREYDPITREVTVYNSFLGFKLDAVGKARLNTPLIVKVAPGYQKVGEFDLWAYEDYNDALKQFTFTDLKKKEKINRDFDLKYKTIESVKVDDYKTVCPEVDFNETIVCDKVKVGSHYEDREKWVKITPADLRKNEVLTIGIFTVVKEGDYVDWIPTIYGEKVPEWAGWEASYDVSAIAYYLADGDHTDELGSYDGTNGGTTFASGNKDQAFDFEYSESDYINLHDLDLPNEFSFMTWAKTDDGTHDSANFFFGKYVGTGCKENGKFYLTNGAFTFYHSDGTFYGATFAETMPTETWTHIALTRSGSNTMLYINGVNVENETIGGTMCGNTGDRCLGCGNEGAMGGAPWDGLMDDPYFWGRTLTATEIYDIYSNNVSYGDVGDLPPTITLNSPASANSTTPQTPTINLTASDDLNLADIKLYINDVLNQTNASGINNSVYLFDLTLGEGDYTIYGKATDNISQETNSSAIRIVIDGTAPTITLNSPIATEITTTLPKNSTLNVTTADTHLSTCWYYTSDNSTNITYTCNTATNISFNTGGYKSIYAFVNDTFGNENSTSTTYLINYIQESATYDATVVEAESHTLILNITASEITSFNGTLHYNGTDYTPTLTTSGNTSILTSTLTASTITANELVYFNWTYNLNGVDYNSSNYNQTIIFLTPLVISASCSDKALRFDLQDEGNLSSFSGEVEYNFEYGLSNGSLKTVHGSLTGVTTFYACINATVSENYTLGYGEIQYRDGIYVDRRYYLFEGQTISNNTLTNHTLRDLLSADQTSFLLTMEDTSLNVYAEKYTALWRWYPDLGEYQIVGMGKTDDDGETVAHVQTEDVDYRVGLYETDGTLIKLDNPRRFVCTSAPCSLTIRVGAGDVDYSSVFDVQAEITYDEDTGVFLLIYNDPNQLTSEMRFLVTRETGTNTLIICNDTSSGFSGAMSCNTSMYNGLKKAVAYRSASPELPIAQKVVSKINTTFNSGFGLFISVILWLAIVLSGFGNNPIWTIILSVVGLIPALIMGSINIAIFTAIAVLASIIIHFIKRTVAR